MTLTLLADNNILTPPPTHTLFTLSPKSKRTSALRKLHSDEQPPMLNIFLRTNSFPNN